jgi:hypothetical protein
MSDKFFTNAQISPYEKCKKEKVGGGRGEGGEVPNSRAEKPDSQPG